MPQGTQDNHGLKSIVKCRFPKSETEEFHREALSLSLTNIAKFFLKHELLIKILKFQSKLQINDTFST